MTKLSLFNRIAVAIYLASPTVLTSLVDQHVLAQATAVTIAAGVTAVGAAFHLGQAAVNVSTPTPPLPNFPAIPLPPDSTRAANMGVA